MREFAASTWARTFVPRAVRLGADRQVCVQNPLVLSLLIAALYFSSADLCFAGSFSSHTASLKSLPAKNWSAILMWHLIAAAASLPSSLPTVSAHLRLFEVCGTQPASSPVPS